MILKRGVTRREFLSHCGRGIGLLCLGGIVGGQAGMALADRTKNVVRFFEVKERQKV